MNSRAARSRLGDLWTRAAMLEVACHRYDRHGRLGLARLIAEHGADMGLHDLRDVLAGDCPHVRAARTTSAALYLFRSCRAFSCNERR